MQPNKCALSPVKKKNTIFKKHIRSRSAGFWWSQLIGIQTAFSSTQSIHNDNRIAPMDWLKNTWFFFFTHYSILDSKGTERAFIRASELQLSYFRLQIMATKHHTYQWPGQFIGFKPYFSFSISNLNMPSWNHKIKHKIEQANLTSNWYPRRNYVRFFLWHEGN